MRFEPRQYQTDCVKAWLESFQMPESTPLVAVPTGAGKTVIMCEFIVQWLETHPNDNILILSHTQEIIRQDYVALLEFFPAFGVGIYSAGLESKNRRKITVGGIQSVYRKPELFQDFQLCIVDEAHTINHDSRGMYRSFFDNVNLLIGGMTATVFRSGHGYIHKGDKTLFNTIAYDLTSVKNFNKLVEDEYLTKLVSKETEYVLNTDGVAKSAGDYNLKSLALKVDRHHITEVAVDETIKYGNRYKKWLIFAIDIDHANNIYKMLCLKGIDADVLHSRMTKNRLEVIDRFKYRDTRALVSVGMVTTGFDAPNVDLIVLLRPTLSTVLHVQMVGRGLRTSPNKDHCLVLDFAGNTALLGPINNPVIPFKAGTRSKAEKGQKPTKTCPVCKCINNIRAQICEVCGRSFQMRTRLKFNADGTPIVEGAGSKFDKDWLTVLNVFYNIHKKQDKPTSLKVSYVCGARIVTEWVCLNHTGFAKAKADRWFQRREPTCNILTTEMAYNRRHKIAKPLRIKVKEGRYTQVVDFEFKEDI